MRIPRFVVSVSALFLLAGCSQHKLEADYHDFGNWWSSKPSHMEKKWGAVPSGYFGENAAGRAVLHPPGMEPPPPEAWRQLDNYGPAPVMAATPGAPPPVEYNDSVSVYPLGEDEAGIRPHHIIEQPASSAVPEPVYAEPMSAMPMGYGDKVDQLYFAHGSARIGAADHKHLSGVAKHLKRRKHGVALTIVGHASHRVNTTKDPIRKKEINFEMAQKRANAVTNALTHAGVDPGWVMAVSKGDDEPNPHRGKRSQEAADRRVEVFVNK